MSVGHVFRDRHSAPTTRRVKPRRRAGSGGRVRPARAKWSDARSGARGQDHGEGRAACRVRAIGMGHEPTQGHVGHVYRGGCPVGLAHAIRSGTRAKSRTRPRARARGARGVRVQGWVPDLDFLYTGGARARGARVQRQVPRRVHAQIAYFRAYLESEPAERVRGARVQGCPRPCSSPRPRAPKARHLAPASASSWRYASPNAICELRLLAAVVNTDAG